MPEPPRSALATSNLSATEVSLEMNESKQLTATVLPTNATVKTVVWRSSKPSVASVDENGNVTGKSEGVATISARTVDGDLIAQATVIVTNAESDDDGDDEDDSITIGSLSFLSWLSMLVLLIPSIRRKP